MTKRERNAPISPDLPLPTLQRLTLTERSRLPGLRSDLARDAQAWFRDVRKFIPDKTFHVLGLIVGASAPDAPSDALRETMRFCVWMYLLDYYVDEMPGVDDAYLGELQRRMQMALERDAPDAYAPFLDRSLSMLVLDFARRPPAGALLPRFKKQIHRELAASHALYGMGIRRDGTLTSYLEQATHCVNHISCTMALLFAIGDPLSDSDCGRLTPLFELAARSVRMANDLRTYEKDAAEGRPHILAFEWDRERVLREIADTLCRFEVELDAAAKAGMPTASLEGIRRITRLGVEIYDITDIKLDLEPEQENG